MRKKEENIDQKLHEIISNQLPKERISDLVNYCTSNGANYSQMLNYIETIVKSLLDSYISTINQIPESYMEIEKAKQTLNYRDIRSVIQWCKKNGVFVFEQGKRLLVSKSEFLTSFHKPFVEHLKRSHENWQEMFEGFIRGEISNSLIIQQEQKVIAHSYSPKSDVEKSFLKKIKEI